MALLRQKVESFTGAPSGSVALTPSTSSALSVVAESIPLEERGRRTRVVCSELDFPTLAYQWAAKPEVELVVLPSPDGVGMDPEQYAEVVDERTLFLATSHVFFATGFVQDLGRLSAIAREKGAYCLIDGYHGAGQVPLDLPASGVDFYTWGPLKWLCGGPGLAYLYIRSEVIQRLEPRVTGWFAAANGFDFDIHNFRFHDDARRFEMGTPALPTVHTALGGQEIIDEVGMETIYERNRELSGLLVEGCRERGYALTLPDRESRRSAIVMIRHPDPAGAVRHLAASGVIVDHRPGHIRVSPHFYNTAEEIEIFFRVMEGFGS
jgi:selenocysteine lyase/cysteine desulfurase